MSNDVDEGEGKKTRRKQPIAKRNLEIDIIQNEEEIDNHENQEEIENVDQIEEENQKQNQQIEDQNQEEIENVDQIEEENQQMEDQNQEEVENVDQKLGIAVQLESLADDIQEDQFELEVRKQQSILDEIVEEN